MYDWTNRYMLAPSGMYWDKINNKGEIDRTHFSYNQGAMIGAGVVLSRLTGETAHLRRAETTADATVHYFTDRVDVHNTPAFDAIFYHKLLMLDLARGTTTYRAAMQTYAERFGAVMREMQGPIHLLDQSAMVQLDALVAGYAVI
jgi:predicted alpha-1,6-mannanase (GH76 family)